VREELAVWSLTISKRAQKRIIHKYLLFQLGILFLGMNQIENNIETTSQHERKEKAKAGQVCVPLRAVEEEQV
jgi:hypothetical protein